jgi:transcription elongation factor Elf1
MKLHPFYEVVKNAEKQVKQGATVYQRFACEACGNDTLGIEEPNKFYKTATCDQCGHTTDLEKTGCNFLLVVNLRERSNVKET